MGLAFRLKTLTVAVAALSIANFANAAGLDRSGQDITAFLQDGLYAEASYTYLDADVTGYDNADISNDNNAYQKGNKINDIAESYDFFRYGIKADINDTFSVGILYDEPYGAAADYVGDSNFVARGDRDAVIRDVTGNPAITEGIADAEIGRLTDIVIDQSTPQAEREAAISSITGLRTAKAIADAEEATTGEGTNVEVRSENITAILGAKFGPNKNFQVYGGPVAQQIRADVKLRGLAYSAATGYTANISNDQAYGWLAGLSYSKPEIALKAALTYRSEIDHSSPIYEQYPAVGLAKGDSIDITTPESVNFDFQTGINPTTLATARVRWVPWGDFAIVPPLYTDVSKTRYPEGLPLVSYDDDQWMVELGLAKRLAPALAISGNIGWDSGAGNPVTSLGPIEGYYSAGLGAKYNVTENWAVSAGGKYLWFGDAKGKTPTQNIVSDFESNDGYVLGVKVSYQAQ
ncbi:hypothetical protein [uncultured Psychrobacter sp.]|uniref:hypothetical protein n=1 Tax=uncultured Psychrobacter sp. TaxID=259303 RepID=UPI003458A24A